MTRKGHDSTESGVLVYPRMPVPKPQDRDSSPRPPRRRSRVNKVLIGVIGGAVLGGVAIGMMLRPIVAPDARIGEARQQAAEAGSAAAAQKSRADGLQKELDGVTAKKREVEQRLAVASKAEAKLADSAAAADKQAKELAGAQKKLAGALKGSAAVTVDGAALRVSINTGALFAKDDQLSDRGKQIVERVGAALKEMSDQDALIEGHTDDTPPPAPKPAAPAPPKRPGARAPAPAPAPARPPTNWELSASRAVAVVRHLQEASKIDPARLSAAAFGQYRPASRRDKAANRRIEIVLTTRARR